MRVKGRGKEDKLVGRRGREETEGKGEGNQMNGEGIRKGTKGR